VINFRGICPSCNRLSLVSLNTPCPNVFNDGRICGYALTTDVASGNRTYRAKQDKHTRPPPSGALGEHSWSSPGLYDVHQTVAFASGNLSYDTINNYFCLTAPIGSGEARVSYQQSGTTEDAWRVAMPLNSKWPNLHLHYRESEAGLIPITSGDFVFAVSGILVSGVEKKAYSVWQSGHVVAVYDPVTSGLVTFS
jgi:hypothetical protein